MSLPTFFAGSEAREILTSFLKAHAIGAASFLRILKLDRVVFPEADGTTIIVSWFLI
jgi:hypothetical protein